MKKLLIKLNILKFNNYIVMCNMDGYVKKKPWTRYTKNTLVLDQNWVLTDAQSPGIRTSLVRITSVALQSVNSALKS